MYSTLGGTPPHAEMELSSRHDSGQHHPGFFLVRWGVPGRGGVVVLLADLGVRWGMGVVTAVRAQAGEQAQSVLGGAAGGRGQHQ